MPIFGAVSPLRIDRKVRQNCRVFCLSGILDLFSLPTFHTVLAHCTGEGFKNCVLDLTCVDQIDYSALGALVDLSQKIRQDGGTLQVVGSPLIARVITSACLEQILSLQPSLDAAIENLEKR